MDTFENNDFSENQPLQEPAPEPQQEPQPPQCSAGAYHAAGTGRKESPYANSPYEPYRPSQPEYQYIPQSQPPEKPKKQKKSGRKLWKPLLAGILAIALVAGSCMITAARVNEYWEERTEDTVEMLTERIDDLQKQIDAAQTLTPGTLPAGTEFTPGAVYKQCVNSVVAISCTIQSPSAYGTTGISSGSGFILSDNGYIATNYHVVEGATKITVVTRDGTEYPATLVGYDDSANDLAVLKVEASGLPAAVIGKSADLVIGDMVVAIGNPLGELTSTQTVGYVSGIGREISTGSVTTISMIQTDAAINPGNSGGPLFNMRGEVVGITTAKYSGSTIEGIGFAIPIDDVMNVMDDLIDFGYVTGAYMGVTIQNTDEASAAMFGLPTGAYIVTVEQGSAAHKAGIQPKDIVIRLGEYKVSNATDLTRALRNFNAGDTTQITVIRSGAEVTMDITLDEKPKDTTPATTPQPTPSMPSDGSYDEWFDFFRRYFGQ